jgi:hypothetical protein
MLDRPGRALSSSSVLSLVASLTSIPSNFLFPSVAGRRTDIAPRKLPLPGLPASAFRNIAIIFSSLNRLFFTEVLLKKKQKMKQATGDKNEINETVFNPAIVGS